MTEPALRAVSCAGFFVLLAIAWAFSSDRKEIDRRLVGLGVAIQFLLAIVLLLSPIGGVFFSLVKIPVDVLISVTRAFVQFVFVALADIGHSFSFNVLPVLLFI